MKRPTLPAFSNRAKWVKVGIFGLLLVFAIVASYYTTRSGFRFGLGIPSLNVSVDKPLEADNLPTREFFAEVDDLTYNELREKAPNVVTSPNIQDPEMLAEYDKVVQNTEPENNIVVFGAEGLSNPGVVIPQGDIVTWMNRTSTPMDIKGDGWGTAISIAPGEGFSHGFAYLGIYEYTINEDDEFKGTVEVIKPTQ